MGQVAKELTPSLSAKDRFGAELRYWRERRRLSQVRLARLIFVSADLVAKTEKAQRWPTPRLAQRCDQVLETGGALTELWPAVEAERREEIATPTLVDPELVSHWSRMLMVLAATDNAIGVHGLAAVVTHEIVLISRHRRATTGRLKDQLARVESQWLEFASWIADNDGHAWNATDRLKRAKTLADQAGDTALAGYITMRNAQRAIEAGTPSTAMALIGYMSGKEALPPRTRALCLVREAQAHALAGDDTKASSTLTSAYRILDRDAGDELDATLAGHCTPVYVRAHEAHCRLLLGDATTAVTEYRAVLADWPERHRLDEGLFRAQLAVALERAGMGDEADSEGKRALTLATQTGSRRTLVTLAALAKQRIKTVPALGDNAFLDAWQLAATKGKA